MSECCGGEMLAEKKTGGRAKAESRAIKRAKAWGKEEAPIRGVAPRECQGEPRESQVE